MILLFSLSSIFAQDKAIMDLPQLAGEYAEGIEEDWLVKKVELDAGVED